ncbi:hypothetical protein GF324_04260 [bacterium]|nr:hypothetical protein [bacterium]
MRNGIRTAAVAAGMLLLATAGLATPEYAQRYNQTCGLCHHNPTGGGMRTLYGAQFFSYTDLPVKPMTFEEVEKVQPKLSENVQVGADFRGIYWNRNDFDGSDDDAGDSNDFQFMQADLYVAYMVSDKSLLYLNVSDNGTREAFAQFRALPFDGTIRAGRFTPAFGWKFPDHTIFTRRFTGYGFLEGASAASYDTGVEAGIYPQGWDATVGVFNGGRDAGKTVVARLAKRLEFNPFKMTLGGSYRYEDWGGGGDFFPTSYGGFYGLQWGRLAFLGEVDAIEETADVMGLVSTQQLRYMLQRGIYLNSWYEYFDPDMDTASGWFWRARLGVEYIPRGYMAISPSFEWNRDDTGAEYGLGVLQLHLWF